MKFGVSIFATDTSMPTPELGRALEERGFESLWIPEHSHIPVDRLGPTGQTLPEHYWRSLDPFVVLSATAAVTTRLKLGLGVCLVIQRDPIQTAKEVASLDFISQGRCLLGIGGGWNRQEMADHGCDFASRWRRLRDYMEAMKVLWTADEAEYHGPFVSFDKCLAYPKPVQKPYPPILMGGNGPRTLDRVAEFCDEWFPLYATVPDFAASIASLRDKTAAAGRDPQAVAVSVFMTPPEPEVVEKLQALGVSRVCFGLPSAGADVILPLIDSWAARFLA